MNQKVKNNRASTYDDKLYRFSFDHLPVRGQWVRLHNVLGEANRVHNYPEDVQVLLGEMFAAVAMFADNLKFDGAVALQSKGAGQIRQTLAECREHKLLRGIVHFAEANPGTTAAPRSLLNWLSTDAEPTAAPPQLALSLIPAAHSQQSTYQAFVPLSKANLAHNLEDYFATSEQLPTRLFFASSAGQGCTTGLLLQRLPSADLASEVQLATHDEAWHTLETLADTLTSAELAELSPARLLTRLFNEFECRLHEPQSLEYRCTCSRQKTDRTLQVLDAAELQDILQQEGAVEVVCEFCGNRYSYDAVDISQLQATPTSPAGNPTGPQDGAVH